MTEIIEIKRKEFSVLEKMGEHSFKVERKGNIYFLKKYENKNELNDFIEKQRRLKITAIDIPKVILFDKDKLISVVEFIEGDNIFDLLVKEDITDEEIYKRIFLDEWYARREKLHIDLKPENFIYTGKKLVYLPYEYSKYDPNYNFMNTDLRLWFPTKELSKYVKSKGLQFDDKRVGNEYATNKQMALMTVKYYI